MDGRTVPDEQELSREVLGQVAEKRDDLLFADAVGVGLREDPAVEADVADG